MSKCISFLINKRFLISKASKEKSGALTCNRVRTASSFGSCEKYIYNQESIYGINKKNCRENMWNNKESVLGPEVLL